MEPAVKFSFNHYLGFVDSSQKIQRMHLKLQTNGSPATVWQMFGARKPAIGWSGLESHFEELRQAFFALKATPFRTGFSRNHFVT
jgi:hypothetical protein